MRGDASDEPALAAIIEGADVVVSALSPPGAIADSFRDVYSTIARLTDTAKAPPFIVGGYSSLRPAPGAPRFVSDLSHAPAEFHAELTTVAALVADDLPATPASLDWVFVSPAGTFGSYVPGERLRRYRVGDDVALQPEDGGEISGADYALGFVDIIEQGNHHRAHINLGYWAGGSAQAEPRPGVALPFQHIDRLDVSVIGQRRARTLPVHIRRILGEEERQIQQSTAQHTTAQAMARRVRRTIRYTGMEPRMTSISV